MTRKTKKLKTKNQNLKKALGIDWRIILPVIASFAFLGGYLIWNVFAASNVNCYKPTDTKLNYCVNDSNESKVARLYFGILGRKPDSQGLTYWSRQISPQNQKRKSLQDISNSFLKSSEFKRKFNSRNRLSDTDFVKTIYRNTFNRNPNSNDLLFWTNQIRQGKTRAWVVVSLTQSQEAKLLYQLKVAESLGFKSQWINRPAEVRTTYSIVVVAGQSNAVGNESYVSQSPAFRDNHPAYSSYPMSFKIYSQDDANTPVNIRTAQKDSSNKQIFGPEIGFARTMYEKGKRNIVIVKVARGGTPLHKRSGHDWNVSSQNENYDDMIAQIKKASQWITDRGASYRVDGLIWMQGETDTVYNQGANDYYANIDNLWQSFKKDLKAQPNSKMVVGKIDLARHWQARKRAGNCAPSNPNTCASEISNTAKVQAAQESFARNKSDVSIITTGDLPVVPGHQIHYSATGQLELGKRFANSFLKAQ